MKSALIQSVFKDELERTIRLISRYQKEIDLLPKGSIFHRQIGNQIYLYLNYREGNKVISKFLGKPESYNEEELKSKLEKRKELSQLI
ncbi:hypothetical protein, partial [Treponema sp. JC4]|uniref:hypothetical protein n=1 Tax=Treponema sp. JC4 TaxID=1124982 RepID=UPI0005875752